VLHLQACNRIQYSVRFVAFVFARDGHDLGSYSPETASSDSCTRHERNPKISIGSFRLKLAHEDFYDLEFTRTTLVSHPNFSDTGAAQNLR